MIYFQKGKQGSTVFKIEGVNEKANQERWGPDCLTNRHFWLSGLLCPDLQSEKTYALFCWPLSLEMIKVNMGLLYTTQQIGTDRTNFFL